MPDALALWGEQVLLDRYRTNPPRYVIVAQVDATEHGATFFGRDYALQTLAWVKQRYVVVGTAGGSPFEPGTLGLMLFRLRDAAPASAQEAARP
jgi:hypothetical protein